MLSTMTGSLQMSEVDRSAGVRPDLLRWRNRCEQPCSHLQRSPILYHTHSRHPSIFRRFAAGHKDKHAVHNTQSDGADCYTHTLLAACDGRAHVVLRHARAILFDSLISLTLLPTPPSCALYWASASDYIAAYIRSPPLLAIIRTSSGAVLMALW